MPWSALVEWFKKVGRSPDEETEMRAVRPEMRGRNRLVTAHSFLRGAHLIPVYGRQYVDAFEAFHVNKYVDHRDNEIAF